ncbi:hypothetical protein C9J48_01540 [Photobacterium profundum]|uniref:Outer membrane protein beta-barrel domain-containing protein n=1 Tax=Photobacterium profundum 3TCK TaxID=314280 RepID=Q1Z5C5_9GAMM|nr:hypothetical protein [Photobacterium profundum]EAS43641.1 hypothetical protein P3TCK_17717 [Photobacterium profundum 3TCK]PSV64174.1 hypothetical protein C9J48_01540 [Photobacterium profundum]
MKKTAIVLIMLSAAAATQVQASDLEYSAGLGLSADNNHLVGSSNETYIFRAGVIADESHRFLGTYTFSNNSKLSKYMGSYDYLYSLDDAKRFNLVTGVTVGYKYQDTKALDNKGHYVYGGQAGFNYRITKNISTEIGYRLLNASSQESESYNDEAYLTMDYIF